MSKKTEGAYQHLKSRTVFEFTDAVMESGYEGSAQAYLEEHHDKTMEQVTEEELQKITQDIKDKGPGALQPGKDAHA